MYNGLLGLHSLLRWALIIFLIINIIRVNVEADEDFDAVDKKWSLRLLITTHINLLVGLYLYFFGSNGLPLLKNDNYTFKDAMHIAPLRFWLVEHPSMMLLSIILITISHSTSKKMVSPKKKHRTMAILYVLALIIILAAVPWPFRHDIARPWFRGLQ